MQRIKFFTMELAKVKERGEFRCPKCGIEISPDDGTEDVYMILEPVMKGDNLQKIVLQCNKCGSQIHLTGFHILNRIR